MTGVGHGIVGAACGITCMPASLSHRQKVLHLLAFIALANLPDLPVPPYWGHSLYYFSHSLFVNLAVIGVSVAIMYFLVGFVPGARDNPTYRWIILAGGLAWLSHLLLDTFYNHGKGLLMFWPLSTARLALPVPWLAVLTRPRLPLKVARILLLELVTFAPVLFLAIWHRAGPTSLRMK